MALVRFVPLAALLLAGCGGGDEPERVPVPDVRGMNTVDAEHALQAAGLRWREGDTPPESRPSRWVLADPEPPLVTGQRPAPGEQVERGTVVGLGQAPPFGTRAIAREKAFPVAFRRVRPTSDPRVVRVLVPSLGCFRVHSIRTQIAGDVAIADILARTPGRLRGCSPPRGRPGLWVRVRFDAPVTDKAIVSGPIVRPRPATDAEPRRWSRAVPVSADGRTLAVTWMSGAAGCHALAGVEASETASAVTITVREGRPPGPARPCFAYGLTRTALVRLREPLGDRAIERPPRPVAVPDVRGMQAFEAQHLLAAAGLRWQEGRTGVPAKVPQPHGAISGRRLVVRQDPAPGERVLTGTVLSLEHSGWFDPEAAPPRYPELFDRVRATGDPNVAEVAIPMSSCERPGRVLTAIAGDVAVVTIYARAADTRECGRVERRWIAARFDEPVGDRAILPLPVLRPRPAVDVRRERWEEAEVVSTDGRTVAVRWTSGVPHCHALAGIRVEEKRRTVRLTLRVGWPKGSEPGPCILLGLTAAATVRLREALGSRRLVDGARR